MQALDDAVTKAEKAHTLVQEDLEAWEFDPESYVVVPYLVLLIFGIVEIDPNSWSVCACVCLYDVNGVRMCVHGACYSDAGKRLLGRCKSLLDQNQELGAKLSQDSITPLQTQVAELEATNTKLNEDIKVCCTQYTLYSMCVKSFIGVPAFPSSFGVSLLLCSCGYHSLLAVMFMWLSFKKPFRRHVTLTYPSLRSLFHLSTDGLQRSCKSLLCSTTNS
jgi:hypothetical protein